LKDIARSVQASEAAADNKIYDVSVRVEGRTLVYTYHSKEPIADLAAFYRGIGLQQKQVLENYCAGDNNFLREIARATISQIRFQW
jgi:hypothetical protein